MNGIVLWQGRKQFSGGDVEASSFVTDYREPINAFQVFDSINVGPVSCAWVVIDIIV